MKNVSFTTTANVDEYNQDLRSQNKIFKSFFFQNKNTAEINALTHRSVKVFVGSGFQAIVSYDATFVHGLFYIA